MVDSRSLVGLLGRFGDTKVYVNVPIVSGSYAFKMVTTVLGGASSEILNFHGPGPQVGATSFLSKTVTRTYPKGIVGKRYKRDFDLINSVMCSVPSVSGITSAFEVYASTRSLLVGISEHEEGEEEEEEEDDEEEEEEEEEGKEEKSSGFTIYLPIMYRNYELRV
ncbi:hypothetical protein V1477_013950 [Vespula maculifrons]|uniref:Uncharacterized protein n=1 Tax=Vespula maculifrons TaxID=7453 RepID=A0ABD2BL73_VESMC